MGLTAIKIEGNTKYFVENKSGTRKFYKKMRNRIIRHTPLDKDVLPKKYDAWEW